MASIEQISGIGPTYGERLRSLEIRTTEALLKAGATPQGRQELAEKVGVSADTILKWVNRADLMRITGIGEQYSDLLEAAGVDTVMELARRNPENLHQKLVEINAEKGLVRRLPNLTMVADWIEKAKGLERAVSY
jgi:predicted flap endonuclease-1-like 5' DNA nuclease